MSYKKIPYQVGMQVIGRFKPSEETLSLITEDSSINESIEILNANEQYFDLCQFFAHALPVREAIWWAALCLEQRKEDWNPTQIQCIETAKSWAQTPSEELRRKAELFATRLNVNCGPSWLAQAVFWNGSGSIVAPDLPQVMPDALLYSKAVAGSINHAAALPEWEHTHRYYHYAIETATNIAKGGT
ncbi:hypothetical protein KP803_17970 [Vibrio sp. ZSDE26]|uniref:Twin-arginine translocation pathway signal n=1 Tax=Vibrio amylolyticus TaxID=2847292 RepID=A0A9X1XKW8_9VIBR|nr:hypothetical protein [Vibrio amylolyticus]MCK6265167.1 hypothetical protein [Vibrio amylolyticus]